MAALTANEEAQLAQTIEMFEVITQSQPLDYASLEILKEAYYKLGRHEEVVQTSRRIAQAYVQLGQLSSAILEYESILQQFPDDPDVRKALAQIESTASSLSAPEGATEILDIASVRQSGRRTAPREIDDGAKTMRRLFVEGRLLSDADFVQHWPVVHPSESPEAVVEPFIHALAKRNLVPLERSLRVISDKSRCAYLSLEKYDVDAELTRSFPRDLCLRWCVLPFDRMSKSVIVATTNPFNKQCIWELENSTKSRLIFYLSQPEDILRMLRKIFR